MARTLVWLGLVPPNQDADQMSETMKAVVRKADVPLFCFSLRCLATDKVVHDFFDPKKYPPPAEGHDGAMVAERLADLYKAATSKSRPKPAAKPAETKAAAKPAKGSAKPAAKSAAPVKKKAAAKPTATKKVAKKAR
jgi:hypothetical protein